MHISRRLTSWRTWLIATVSISLLFGLATAINSGAATTTITTTGDSFVTSQYKNANRGSAKEIRADVEGKNLRTGYVKFAVPSISGTITSASLELDVKNAKPAGFMIHNTSDFNEMTINYKNAPSVGTMAGFVNSAKKGHISIDVTKSVTANRTVAFAIVSTGRTIFSSKEAGNSVAPKLKIDSTTATTGAPSTSTTARATTSTTAQATTSTTRAASTVPTVPGTSDCKSATFCADFTSKSDLDQFDWQIFHGGVDPFPRGDQPKSWHGDHNMDCEGPTTLRDVNLVGETRPGPVSTAGNMVWYCAPGGDAAKGHVMTSTALVAYGHIDFSPRQMFTDVNRVCWDQNWTEMGGRKWTQVTIVPEALFNSHNGNMQYVTKGLQGDVAANGFALTSGWMLEMLRASTAVQVGQEITHSNAGGFMTPDKARRFHHCAIDQGNGTVRLELERENGTEVRIAPGSFPKGRARVIFQDVTYDSLKGSLPSDQATQTNTWHWDNIQVNAR